jgi:hypothetical protein
VAVWPDSGGDGGGREEVADMWVPHVSDRGERRCGWKEKAHSH